MCVPKPPKVEKIPERQAAVLPDLGDPGVRAGDKARRRFAGRAMIFTNQGSLGAPSVSGPLGK